MKLPPKKFAATILLLVFISTPILQAVDSKKAAYHGGTASVFVNAKEPVEGRLDTKSETDIVFTAEDKPFVGRVVTIPYANVIDLEYGQKAGRRVGAAIGTAVLLGPLGLFTLFSKKRKHYLTIGYTDESAKDHVAVIELGKDVVRTTLAIVETRSGKKIEYQDEEARKGNKGGN
jgi:hypothetical protein